MAGFGGRARHADGVAAVRAVVAGHGAGAAAAFARGGGGAAMRGCTTRRSLAYGRGSDSGLWGGIEFVALPYGRGPLKEIAPSRLMPHSFPNIGNAAEFVGQTPWSARDALVPLSARRIKALHATMADEGVGRGRGRPPYNLRRCSALGKLCGIYVALTVRERSTGLPDT